MTARPSSGGAPPSVSARVPSSAGARPRSSQATGSSLLTVTRSVSCARAGRTSGSGSTVTVMVGAVKSKVTPPNPWLVFPASSVATTTTSWNPSASRSASGVYSKV